MKKVFKEVAEHAIMTYAAFEAEYDISSDVAQQRAIDYITSDEYRAGFPIVVCLCGSTRFSQAFRDANLTETLAGKIVLTIGCDMRTDDDIFGHMAEDELRHTKAALDALHMHKIELADEVLILNVDGYIGESTRRELNYAQALGKYIRYLEPPEADSSV